MITHFAIHNKILDYILDLIYPNSTQYEQRSINIFKLKNTINHYQFIKASYTIPTPCTSTT